MDSDGLIEPRFMPGAKESFAQAFPDISIDELREIDIRARNGQVHYYHPTQDKVYTYNFMFKEWTEKPSSEKDRLLQVRRMLQMFRR